MHDSVNYFFVNTCHCPSKVNGICQQIFRNRRIEIHNVEFSERALFLFFFFLNHDSSMALLTFLFTSSI